MFKRQQEFLSTICSDESLSDLDKTFTHLITLPSEKKLNIRDKHIPNFWLGYADLINQQDGQVLSISETVGKTVPLICDLDFIFKVDSNDEEFPEINDTFILMLVACVQETLKTLFALPNGDADRFMICFVLRPEEGIRIPQTNTVKESIRLQFPYARIEPMAAKNRIFPEIINLFRKRNVLSKLETQPHSDWEKILNDNIYMEPVLMYGSIKGTFEKRKNIYKVLETVEKFHIDNPHNQPEVDIDSRYFNVVLHADVRKKLFDPFKVETDYDYWSVLFLSLNYWDDGVLHFKSDNVAINRNPINANQTPAQESTWDTTLNFLRMIPVDEKNIIYIWYDIGKILYNESINKAEGLEAWVTLTNEEIDNESLTEEICRDVYPTFGTSNLLTMKSMAWYARKYNPVEYKKWHKDKMANFKELALTKFDSDVADALYHSYWLDYVYATSPGKRSGGTWYKFKHNHWFKMDQALDISHLVSTDFYMEFARMSRDLADQRANTNDETIREQCTFKITRVEALIKKLKTYSTKQSIIREATTRFHDENFEKLLDTNLATMGHLNKIHELIQDTIYFRDGKPEDYTSKSTGVSYDDKMDEILPDGTKAGWKHPRVLQLQKWFGQVFVDVAIMDSFLNFCASLIIRGNEDKIIPILSGNGDNSKSMIEKLFELLLGVYCFKFDNNSITGKGSGGPSPELAQAHGGALGIFDEMEETEGVKAGFLKKVSGGDTFFARFLHDNGGKIEAIFKIIIVCNIIPKINSVQKAIRSRIAIYMFDSTWVEPDLAPKTEEEQYKLRCFPMNRKFNNEIPKMAPAFLWMLKERYPTYLKEGIVRTEKMKQAAGEYWSDIDVYKMFQLECLEEAFKIDPETKEKVRDRDTKLMVGDCFKEFKMWFKSSYEGEKVPNLRDFKVNSINYFGKPIDNKYWMGLKIQEKKMPGLYDGPSFGNDGSMNMMRSAYVPKI